MVTERFIFESKNDWEKVRKGLFTASRISEIMAGGKRLMTPEELAEYKKANPKSTAKYTEDDSVISEGAMTYILELIQGLEGAPKEQYYSPSMEWGNEQEPNAAIRYCQMYGYDLTADDVIYTSLGGTVFFVGDGILGCTPDLILPSKLVQFKCPDSSTHLYYKLFVNEANFRTELSDYFYQMQLEMMLCGKPTADFFSYDPRYKRPQMQTHKIEVPAEKEIQNAIHRKAKLCEKKKQELLTHINEL